MNARFANVLRKSLLAWGACSLLAVIGFGAFIGFRLGPGNSNKVDAATAEDVQFILNWCDLGDRQIERVLNSYVSARSFTGDYLDAYAIKIDRVDVAELSAIADEREARWFRGDQLPPLVSDAVQFAGMAIGAGEIPWFPTEHELRSSKVYVYPWAIYTQGIRPTSVQLIFVRPSDKIVFYLSNKT